MNVQGYKVEIQKLNPDLGGGFVAFAPELVGCASDGETPAIALLNLEDAVEMWLDTAREIRRQIPKPSIADA